MTRQAVESFRAQTYPNKKLVVWDTSAERGEYLGWLEPPVLHCYPAAMPTIGELRNHANDNATRLGIDIICHWDSDDWSGPTRIAEQVALLQSSGAECVGYNELLFWREPGKYQCGHMPGPLGMHPVFRLHDGEAWLYSHGSPALGTSLAYWRKTWERRPFPALMTGEDAAFIEGLNLHSVSSLSVPGEPRMIARIHSGNTSKAYNPDLMAACERQGNVWKRVPSFDDICRSAFR
jgi:hypothetical protein